MVADENEKTAPYETETLQAGWLTKTPLRPRIHARLTMGAKTDLGQIRENNEDKFDFMEPYERDVLARKGRVYAVADGMGGHSAGQIAAELALNVFIRSYYADHGADVQVGLTTAVREANEYIVDVARAVPGRQGMGATLTAVAIRDDDMFIAQVGDSRCYLLRGGQIEQLTEDHSWVAEQVRSGTMSLEEAEQSPFRNVITRSMGGAPEVEPDVLAVKLQVGDRYLLCSDGLSGMVSQSEIQTLLAAEAPSVAVWSLIDRANAYGGKDNITALILDVEELTEWPAEEGALTLDQARQTHELNGHAPEPVTETHLEDVTEGEPTEARELVGAGVGSGVGTEANAKAGLMNRLFRR